jgi:selenocysteine lyase/cysteine desulfurase
MDRSNLTFAKGARRFDLGNYNYIGATAVAASIELLLDIGITNIERHVRALSRRLASGIRDIGLDVAGGDPGPHLGHIVAVGKSGGGRHYTAEDPAMNSLHEHLSANDVRLAIRRGVLRFSLHVYNTEDDVDRVLQLTRDWYSSRPR